MSELDRLLSCLGGGFSEGSVHRFRVWLKEGVGKEGGVVTCKPVYSFLLFLKSSFKLTLMRVRTFSVRFADLFISLPF